MIDIQKLRNLVLIGIEINDWSAQKVLNSNSIDFFGYILSRTRNSAIFNLACQITCIDHNKNVQGNKYHLFSLPHSVEREIRINELLLNDHQYLNELDEISGGIAIEGKPGPVLVGSSSELSNDVIYRVIAKHYLLAFKNGYKTYPYLN